jgi:phosphatidylglycerophosphate synthase
MTDPMPTSPPLSARAVLPLALTLLRAALAPVIVAIVLIAPSPRLFGACLVAGFLSDVFDGVVARRLGVATAALRRLDSIADTLFYLAATFAAWKLHAETLAQYAAAIVALLSLEVTRYFVDFAKFRREAAYHMWSSKLWGVLMLFAFLNLLDVGGPDAAVPAALAAGIFADVEGLLISLVLPSWQHDVPTLAYALRLRRRLAEARA